MHDVTGSDLLEPRAAALLAAPRVVSQEYPNVACRTADVEAHAEAALAAAQLVAEALSGADDEFVAFRGRRRWVRGWERVRPAGDGRARLREGGVYLLAGGIGGRNDLIAAHLWESVRARLVLVDATLPPRGGWETVIAARLPGDPLREQLERVMALEAAGCEVLTVQAWSNQAAQMEDAVAAAERRFGAVHGVVLSPSLAGLGGFAALSEIRPEGWEKDLGWLHDELAALEAALEGRAPDFVVVESSLTPELGGVGRAPLAAGQAVLDAFCARHNETHATPWTAAGWDRWYGEDEDGKDYGMTPDEARRAFDLLLALSGEPVVRLSTGDLGLRVAGSAAPAASPGAAATHARPELDTEYFAPETELEERIAGMWQELLGIDRIGVHDDFFGLGGHSLLATQIISRVRDLFQLELPLKAIFEAPTVSRFAALIEAAIIAEIEAMSDEEALSLI